MTDTTCRCGERDLLTVREAAALPVLKRVSVPTLYRLIESGRFKARPVSERKTLILVTYWCPIHERKQPDDIDRWLDSLAA